MKKVIDALALLVLMLAIADIVITVLRGSWEAILAVARWNYNSIFKVVMVYRFSLFKPLSLMLLASALPALRGYVEKFRIRYVGMISIIFMVLMNSLELISMRGGDALFTLNLT